MNGYYKRLTELLKANGYSYLRPGNGSHEIWTNGSRNQTVPFNCASRHTANAVLKQAGINQRF